MPKRIGDLEIKLNIKISFWDALKFRLMGLPPECVKKLFDIDRGLFNEFH